MSKTNLPGPTPNGKPVPEDDTDPIEFPEPIEKPGRACRYSGPATWARASILSIASRALEAAGCPCDVHADSVDVTWNGRLFRLDLLDLEAFYEHLERKRDLARD